MKNYSKLTVKKSAKSFFVISFCLKPSKTELTTKREFSNRPIRSEGDRFQTNKELSAIYEGYNIKYINGYVYLFTYVNVCYIIQWWMYIELYKCINIFVHIYLYTQHLSIDLLNFAPSNNPNTKWWNWKYSKSKMHDNCV